MVARTEDKSKKTAAEPSTLSAKDEKRQAIEQAIIDGNEARDGNKYELAVASYEKVLKLDQKDARAHYGLGNVYNDLTCFDSAMGEYREAVRLKKDFRHALIALGNVYTHSQRYDEAEQQFREVLKNTRNDQTAKRGLAFLLAKRKKYDEAIAQLKLIANSRFTGNQGSGRGACGLRKHLRRRAKEI